MRKNAENEFLKTFKVLRDSNPLLSSRVDLTEFLKKAIFGGNTNLWSIL